MLALTQVEIVGEDEAVRLLVALGGPALIAGAAVAAAWIARITTNERQAEQLAHDAERQEMQLEHDTERQEEALAHDRRMRDRESDRAVIDDAVENANRVLEEVSACEGILQALQSALDASKPPEVVEGIQNEARSTLKEARSAATALSFNGIRLRTRPDLDELADKYQEIVENYRRHIRLLRQVIQGNPTAAQTEEIKRVDEEGTEKVASFLLAWRQWLAGS